MDHKLLNRSLDIPGGSAIIRSYESSDAPDIAAFNFLFNLAYQYNGDYKPDRIFCAVLDGKVAASGHLEPTDSCEYLDREGQNPEYIHRFLFDTDAASPEYEVLEKALYYRILDKAKDIQHAYPHKKIQLGHVCSHDDFNTIDFLLSEGFYHELNLFILKRDLTRPLPDLPNPYGIEIRRWPMESDEDKELYLQAEKDGNEGESWSKEKLAWYQNGSEWDTLTAFKDSKPVSSCMTWGISAERSATEQIFTVPEWRRKGIAQLTIVEALKFLRDNHHKTEATLGVIGSKSGSHSAVQEAGL